MARPQPFHFAMWSGRRDSNSRHSAWKAEALPTELLPPGFAGSTCRYFSATTLNSKFSLGLQSESRRKPCSVSRLRWSLLQPTFYADGGGGRIRTSEGIADRFTVCSLWPLGNPTNERRTRIPAAQSTRTRFASWSQRRDSNPRPTDYKSVALPTELRWPRKLTTT